MRTRMDSDKTKESFERAHRALKMKLDIEMPLDDAYYERLHDRIMFAVNEKSIEKTPLLFKQKKWVRLNWKNMAQMCAGVLLALGLGQKIGELSGQLWSSSKTVQLVNNEREIIREAIEAPDAFSRSVLSDQSESEFFMEMARETLNSDQSSDLQAMLEESSK